MDSDKEKIKELELEVAKLRAMLNTDELTRVLNRRGVRERFSVLIDEVLYVRKEGTPHRRLEIDDVSAIFIDLDDFKKVNDTYGHDAGDAVLQTAAEYLARSVRGIDYVGRYGGEEFVIILTGATENEAFEKAKDLKKGLNSLSLGEEIPVKIKGSMGVASVGQSGAESVDALVELADKAMYEAKTNRGKNTVVRWSEIAKGTDVKEK